jgi:hypothetical protein
MLVNSHLLTGRMCTLVEDILESMEGKRFGVLIAHVFEVHDASVHEEEEERVVEYEVVRPSLSDSCFRLSSLVVIALWHNRATIAISSTNYGPKRRSSSRTGLFHACQPTCCPG